MRIIIIIITRIIVQVKPTHKRYKVKVRLPLSHDRVRLCHWSVSTPPPVRSVWFSCTTSEATQWSSSPPSSPCTATLVGSPHWPPFSSWWRLFHLTGMGPNEFVWHSNVPRTTVPGWVTWVRLCRRCERWKGWDWRVVLRNVLPTPVLPK